MESAVEEGVDDNAGGAEVGGTMGGTMDALCRRNQAGGLADKAKETLGPGRQESTDDGSDKATAGHGEAGRYGADKSDCDKETLAGIAATDGRLYDGPTIRAVESVGTDEEERADCEFTSEAATGEEAVADLDTTVGTNTPEFAEEP